MWYTRVRLSSSTLLPVLVAVLVVLAVVSTTEAQDVAAFAETGTSLANSVRITPQIQVGCQRLGLSFNLPALLDSWPLDWPSTLDLELRKADVWCGSLEAVADLSSGLSFGLKGQTNARKNASVYERQDYAEGGTQGVNWTAEQLQWWTIDGRLAYGLKPGLSAVAGLRREQLSFKMTDPTTDQGEPENVDHTGIYFGVPYESHQRYSSSLVSKLWIPYLGLDFMGNGYKASLIASPFASVEVLVPAELAFYLAFHFSPTRSVILRTDEALQYRVLKPAAFLEGNFTYDINVSQAVRLGLWCNASWIRLSGKGDWHYQYSGQSPPSSPSSDSQTQEHTATFTRSLLGGGLSAMVSF
jgi:hypothetical protein